MSALVTKYGQLLCNFGGIFYKYGKWKFLMFKSNLE